MSQDPDSDYAFDKTNQSPRGQSRCHECDDMEGEAVPATRVLDTPWGLLKLCEKHYDQAGERGAEMWSVTDDGPSERSHRADQALRERRK